MEYRAVPRKNTERYRAQIGTVPRVRGKEGADLQSADRMTSWHGAGGKRVIRYGPASCQGGQGMRFGSDAKRL